MVIALAFVPIEDLDLATDVLADELYDESIRLLG